MGDAFKEMLDDLPEAVVTAIAVALFIGALVVLIVAGKPV